MPNKIEIRLRRRWWRPWKKVYRRVLPASWMEVEPARRLPLVRLVLSRPGAGGGLLGIRHLLKVPGRIFKAMTDEDLAALLEALPWLRAKPSAEPSLAWFDLGGVRYYAPLSHGLNLVALEYPIADEAFGNYLRSGDIQDLRLLVGTLYREENLDQEAVNRRGDIRVPLLSRWEAEARAKRLAALPDEVALAVMLYFAGVKGYVYQAYGEYLFVQETEAGTQPVTSPGLGWWSVYFNLAVDGPFGRNVEEVYQSSYHDVCLYLVDRKKQEDRLAMDRRMAQPDFGISNP